MADYATKEDPYNQLTKTINTFLDRYETRKVLENNQFEKLLAWTRKVSEKTSIPLKNV